MNPKESGEYGAKCAETVRDGITHAAGLQGLNKVHFWGGFMSSLIGICVSDIGAGLGTQVTEQMLKAVKRIKKPGKRSGPVTGTMQ